MTAHNCLSSCPRTLTISPHSSSADLVPVFSFGENDVSRHPISPSVCPNSDLALLPPQIYQQMPNEKGTTVHTLQKKFQNAFGFTLPLFHGRGLLNCTCFCSWCTTAVSASAFRVLRSRSRFSHDAFLQITLALCRIAVVSSPSVSTPFVLRLFHPLTH